MNTIQFYFWIITQYFDNTSINILYFIFTIDNYNNFSFLNYLAFVTFSFKNQVWTRTRKSAKTPYFYSKIIIDVDLRYCHCVSLTPFNFSYSIFEIKFCHFSSDHERDFCSAKHAHFAQNFQNAHGHGQMLWAFGQKVTE